MARGDLDLSADSEEEKAELEAAKKSSEDLVERMQAVLTERVAAVRPTVRLTDSPACLVVGEHEMGAQMRRILESAGQALPESKPTLEINPGHPLVKRLDAEQVEDRFVDLSNIIMDQAMLAEGSSLEDPAGYVRRLNKLLVELSDS